MAVVYLFYYLRITLTFFRFALSFYTKFHQLICCPLVFPVTLSPEEEPMSRKKGKVVSFDAMVKFFMQHYNIPTKKDVDRLMAKLDRLENLMKNSMANSAYQLKGSASNSMSKRGR